MNAKDVKSGGFRPLVDWRRAFFEPSMYVMTTLMVIAGAAVYYFKGSYVFWESVGTDIFLLFVFTPKMFLAFIVAALVTALVSREVIARWLGDQAGMKGVTLATGIGAITPGGPMISFPLVAALSRAGSSRASMIAYLTSWEVLGFQRIMIWELPLLGIEYAALRIITSLPLPFVAAFLSMYLPPDRSEKPVEATAKSEAGKSPDNKPDTQP